MVPVPVDSGESRVRAYTHTHILLRYRPAGFARFISPNDSAGVRFGPDEADARRGAQTEDIETGQDAFFFVLFCFSPVYEKSGERVRERVRTAMEIARRVPRDRTNEMQLISTSGRQHTHTRWTAKMRG